MANAALLAHPDENLDLILATDASDVAIGATLYQSRSGSIPGDLVKPSVSIALTIESYLPYLQALKILSTCSRVECFPYIPTTCP